MGKCLNQKKAQSAILPMALPGRLNYYLLNIRKSIKAKTDHTP